VGERYLQLVRTAIERSDALKELQEKVAKEELTLINDQQAMSFSKSSSKPIALSQIFSAVGTPQYYCAASPAATARRKNLRGSSAGPFFRLEGKLPTTAWTYRSTPAVLFPHVPLPRTVT